MPSRVVYQDPMDWQPEHAVSCLKSSPGRAVWLVERDEGSRWVVKRWTWKPSLRLKWMLGMAAAQREARGNRRLLRAKLPCPGEAQVIANPSFAQIILPYVPGETLWDLMKTGQLTVEQARAVGDLVASITRAGLCRRDLKPDNLVVTPDGQVVPIDNDGVLHRRDRAESARRMLAKLEQVPREFGIDVPTAFWDELRRHAIRSEP